MLANLSWATSGAAEGGDFSPGNGITTANRTVQAAVDADKGNIAGLQVLPSMVNHPVGGNAVAWWIALVVAYLVYRYMTKNVKEDKLQIVRIAETTTEAVIGLAVLHWAFSMYNVPGASALVLSA